MKKFVFLLIPIVLLHCWLTASKSYPRYDDAYYFLTTQSIQLAYKAGGLWHGLFHFYFDRGYKPILHPALAAPVLILTGNVLRTIALMGLFYYSVLLIYVYRIFRLRLEVPAAIAGTFVVLLNPWVFALGKSFNSELPPLAAMVTALYYLIRAQRSSCPRSALAFALALGISFCFRPVETMLFFLIPLLAVLVHSSVTRVIQARDLLFLAITTMPFVCMAAWAVLYGGGEVLDWTPHPLLLVLASWLPGILFIGFRKKLGLNTWFMRASYPCYFIVSGWFLPFSVTTFRWAYGASYGASAQFDGGRGAGDLFPFYWHFFSRLAGYPALLLIAVGALSMSGALIWREWKWAFVGLATSLFAVSLGGISLNSDIRYYIGGATVLSMMLISFALNREGMFYRLRLVLVSFLSVFFVALTWAKIYIPEKVPYNVVEAFPEITTPLPLNRILDPSLEMVDRLGSVLPHDHPIKIDTVPFINSPGDLFRVLEGSTLMIISRERGYPWTVDMIDSLGMKNVQEQLAANNAHYDYAVVGPLNGEVVPGAHPIALLADLTRNAYRSGTLEALGLKKLAVVPGHGRDQTQGEFLVVATMPAVH